MSTEQILGSARKGVGKVEEAYGGLAGDAHARAMGKVDQAVGAAQEQIGAARSLVRGYYGDARSFTTDQPLKALALTLGVGVLLGMLMRPR